MKQKLLDPTVLVALFILIIIIMIFVIAAFFGNPPKPIVVTITEASPSFTATFADITSTAIDTAVTQTKAFTATSSTLMTQTDTVSSTNTFQPTTMIAPSFTVPPPLLTRTFASPPTESQSIPTSIPTPVPTKTPTLPNPSTQISLVQSFPAPGSQAHGITWDGIYLWLSENSGVIFKVDASGTVRDSFDAPEVTPQGITWDGSSFWLFTTNHFYIYQFQINGLNTQTISSFLSPASVAGGGLSQDMAWDGDSLWYANQFRVYDLATSGNVLSSFTFPENVTGLDWDGINLWLAYDDFPNNSSLSIVSRTGQTLETYSSPIYQINGLVWADGYLWALGIDSPGGSPMIYKLSISN